jgi:hypothetical protein
MRSLPTPVPTIALAPIIGRNKKKLPTFLRYIPPMIYTYTSASGRACAVVGIRMSGSDRPPLDDDAIQRRQEYVYA